MAGRAQGRRRSASSKLVAAALVAGTPAASAGAESPLRPAAPGTPQRGFGATADRPGFAVLRQDEDWSFLDATGIEARPFDGVRRIDLGGGVQLGFSLDSRLHAELFDDEQFGTFPGDDATLNLRFHPDASLSFGRRARLYLGIETGQVSGRRTPAFAAEDDGPDLHQAFAELAAGDLLGLAISDLLVRVGRQELHYGAGRMISVRIVPNLPTDFNGVTVRLRAGSTIVEAFAVRPSEDRKGVFNNGIDRSRATWGIYASRPIRGPHQLDLYYVGFDRGLSPYAFAAGALAETRHSFGLRYWTDHPSGRLRLDAEAAVQVGAFDGAGIRDGRIRAWTAGFDAAYALPGAPLAPVLNLQAGINSGDGDPADRTLGTFRAPSPPGRYFGEGNPSGPGNQLGFRAFVDLRPAPRLTVSPEFGMQWRLRRRDGSYTPSQDVLRGAAGDNERILAQAALSGEAVLRPGLAFTFRAVAIDAGAYLRDNPPDRDIFYFEAGTIFRF